MFYEQPEYARMILFEFIKSGLTKKEQCIYVSEEDKETVKREMSDAGINEELAQITTKKLAAGEEVSYTAKISPKEKGYYTVYASLYHHNRRIGRNSDIIWVEK